MIEDRSPRYLRGKFSSVGELHVCLDSVELASASRSALLDLVAGYELVRVHAMHKRRQALDHLRGDTG